MTSHPHPPQRLNINISPSKQKNPTGDQRISLIFRDWSLLSTNTYIDNPEQILIVVQMNNYFVVIFKGSVI